MKVDLHGISTKSVYLKCPTQLLAQHFPVISIVHILENRFSCLLHVINEKNCIKFLELKKNPISEVWE